MVGDDDTTARANPFSRAWRQAEAGRRRRIKSELWRWRRKAENDASAGWLQRPPLVNNVRELVRHAQAALRAGESCDTPLAQLRGLEARADYLDMTEAPEIRHGAQFRPGSRPGRRGPLKHWLHEYLDGDPDAGISEVWSALRQHPRSTRSDVAGCVVFAGKQQTRENVKKKLSEARQERKQQGR